MKEHLTENKVRGYKPKDKPFWITDSECKNLRLRVGIGGKKSWYCGCNTNGKDTTYKLGESDIMSVTEARKAATTFKADMLKGILPIKKKEVALTVGELIEKYGAWVVKNRKSGIETLAILRTQFKSLNNKVVSKLSVVDMEKWCSSRKEENIKSSSLNRYRGSFMSMLNWAVEREDIDVNPVLRFKQLEQYDCEPRVRYLSGDEFDRLMEALDKRDREKKLSARLPDTAEFGDHLKPIVLVALCTALRRGSILSLTWGDIDLGAKIITVRAINSKNKKTQKLPINDDLLKILQAWRAQSADTSSTAFVFPSPNGGQMHDCRSAWKGLLKDADIENFRFHDLRHHAATILRKRGASIYEVQQVMGHHDSRMTQRYVHFDNEDMIKTMGLLYLKK
jgi:integrase